MRLEIESMLDNLFFALIGASIGDNAMMWHGFKFSAEWMKL